MSFSISFINFSSYPDNCPDVGIRPLLQTPPCPEGMSSPTNTPVLPPSSFIPPSFACFYIFFSSGQVLLSPFSWYSASTSVSEGVFLTYPWREMYSVSTYSSTILFLPLSSLFFFSFQYIDTSSCWLTLFWIFLMLLWIGLLSLIGYC